MKSSCAALLLSLLAAVAAGCAVDEAKEIETYRSIVDAGAFDIPEEGEPLDVRGTMVLTNAFNERMSIEGEEYLQALLERRRAAAALLPTLSFAPSLALRDQGSNQPTEAFDAPLEAAIAFDPVSDPARIAAAEVSAVAQLALLLDAQDSLLLDAARAHYAVVLADRAVVVLESSLTVQEQRVEDARGRLEAGIVRPLDLSLSESQASQTAVDLLAARRAAITGRRTLRFLTASEVMTRPLVDNLDVPDALPSAEEQRAMALARRADLAAADRLIDAAATNVHVAYGQYFPRVSADLQVFLARETNPQSLDWTSLIQLNLPLFSAGLIETDVRIALSDLRLARFLRAELARLIEQQVNASIDNFEEATARVEQLHVQVEAATDALEQATGSYDVGLATNLERVAAQDFLLNAQLQLVTAELDRKIFYLELRRATGTLHEMIGLDRTDEPWTMNGKANDAAAR